MKLYVNPSIKDWAFLDDEEALSSYLEVVHQNTLEGEWYECYIKIFQQTNHFFSLDAMYMGRRGYNDQTDEYEFILFDPNTPVPDFSQLYNQFEAPIETAVQGDVAFFQPPSVTAWPDPEFNVNPVGYLQNILGKGKQAKKEKEIEPMNKVTESDSYKAASPIVKRRMLGEAYDKLCIDYDLLLKDAVVVKDSYRELVGQLEKKRKEVRVFELKMPDVDTLNKTVEKMMKDLKLVASVPTALISPTMRINNLLGQLWLRMRDEETVDELAD